MPNIVKGSKQERMVVVPHRPWRRLQYFCLALFGMAAAAGTGFIYGYKESPLVGGAEQDYRQQQDDELFRLQSENLALQQTVAQMDSGNTVDQMAKLEVQQIIADLQEKVVQLEQDVVFYRQIMSDEVEGSGLMIGELDITPSTAPRRFHYKLVMGQRDAKGDKYLSGHVNVNVMGTLDGEEVVIPLSEISVNQDRLNIKLRYKYFQNIEGELELPQGFEPAQINIAAVSTEPEEKKIMKNFSWVVDRG